MQQLNSFFNKFKHLAVPHKVVREKCARLCSQCIKKDISIEDVVVKGKIIYINLSPLLKGEVLLHKAELLEALNTIDRADGGGGFFTDIR